MSLKSCVLLRNDINKLLVQHGGNKQTIPNQRNIYAALILNFEFRLAVLVVCPINFAELQEPRLLQEIGVMTTTNISKLLQQTTNYWSLELCKLLGFVLLQIRVERALC